MRKKKTSNVDLSGMSIQARRQYLAKFETFEDAQERVEKKRKLTLKHGVFPSGATISSAYGVMKTIKNEYVQKFKKGRGKKKPNEHYLHIVSIPMGGMNK